jgi:hypothetical protein
MGRSTAFKRMGFLCKIINPALYNTDRKIGGFNRHPRKLIGSGSNETWIGFLRPARAG